MTMSPQQPKSSLQGQEELLKQELQGLPRVSAPWYLESDVLRQLRSPAGGMRWIARPIPAIAVSSVGVVLLGIVGYAVYVTMLVEPASTNRDIETTPVPTSVSPVETTPTTVVPPGERAAEPAMQDARARDKAPAGATHEPVLRSDQPRGIREQILQSDDAAKPVVDTYRVPETVPQPAAVPAARRQDSVRARDTLRPAVDTARAGRSVGKPVIPADTTH